MSFKTTLLRATACAPFALLYALPAVAQDTPVTDEDILTDIILVTAARDPSPAQTDALTPPRQAPLAADAVTIAARAPGGGAIDNGALAGQLSYRGLFGERVVGRVNGQRFASGGPNAMDPPLHYAPSILVDQIAIARGVAPVADGPSLAGAVNAELRQVDFATGDSFTATGSFAAQLRSVDESLAVGGVVGLASNNLRVGLLASREQGEDYRFDGGTAADTAYQRDTFGVHAGARLGEGEVFAEYRRNETGPSGNPPFAMDTLVFDTDFLQAGYRGQVSEALGLNLRVGHVAVRHVMDNNTLRQPTPPAMNLRATIAEADTYTAEGSVRIGSATRNVTIGGDFEQVDKLVRITNPLNADFFLEAQPDLAQQRFGGFAQWRGHAGPVQFELGARVDHVQQDADIPALGSAVPMGPRGLATAFAQTARHTSDTVADLVLRSWLPGDAITPRLTLARKSRVPSLLERFAWLPTEASFGLADGNIYVGNQALEPEIAWIAELGFDFQSEAFALRPTAYYRRVDDFIQGTPFDASVGVIDSPVEMVAAMNGDPTPLMFRNVDAELYGVDFDFRLDPVEHLQIEGVASLVEGKRRDIADNLYRISPASLHVSATWQGTGWAIGTEMQAAADQDAVSATNSEAPSKGYAVFGLFGEVRVAPAMTLAAGVENLFDAYYQPHLAGRSRVGESDVPVGERLPGRGRGVWLRVSAGF